MKITPRESVLFLATAGAALLGGTLLLARPLFDEWKDLRGRQRMVRETTERDQRLLEQKGQWEKEFAELGQKLPALPAGQNVDVYWLSIVDRIATRHGFRIIKRQAGEEKPLGDVYELPIECKEWEGSLESLVLFLVDLQGQGAMLDIRQLLIKPKGQGVLRGRFLLHCAYRRETSKVE